MSAWRGVSTSLGLLPAPNRQLRRLISFRCRSNLLYASVTSAFAAPMMSSANTARVCGVNRVCACVVLRVRTRYECCASEYVSVAETW